MASEIPRWTPSPKKSHYERPITRDDLSLEHMVTSYNEAHITNWESDEEISHPQEYFSSKQMDHSGASIMNQSIPNPQIHDAGTEPRVVHKNVSKVRTVNRENIVESNPSEIHREIGIVQLTSRSSPAGNINSGVWLTWKNLWVIVSNQKGGNKTLLQRLTGYAQPGRVVAIMGPSGSGKSTLLDTLAAKRDLKPKPGVLCAGRLATSTRQTGDILVNGRRQRLSYGTSAYVTQDDMLMSTLTVGEAVFYSAQLQLPDNMSKSEKRERAEMTIREMGLHESVNTTIGGWRSKGISGGEKRRVSIAIEILTRPKLLFLDEPTSGLDSAAAYHVVKRLSSLAKEDGRTVIASIHQPSSEVFELFHNLYLLCGGRTVYFGEASAANQMYADLDIVFDLKFFAANGFPCPSLRNPSDHYLRIINSDFERDIEEGPDGEGHMTTSEVIDLLVRSYQSSETAKAVLNTVNEISTREGRPLETKGSQASFIMQSYVLTKRSFVNMYRDLGYYWLRVAIYIALCLCVGTIYYDVGQDYDSIQARGALLMFVAAFLTFMAIGGFPSFVEDMKIFGRERLNGHYGVGTFVVANTLSSIPYLMLISLVPGAIAYFLVNLHSGLDHFIFFVLVLFACMTLVESLMMIVASIVPDFLMGIITGAGIQGVMMLNGGFFRLPNDLPKPFWRYPMYYIAFHKYANQGFYKNEFEGLNFGSKEVGDASINGDEILRETWHVEMGYSKWVDLLILGGMVIVYRLLFFLIIKLKEKARPIIRKMFSESKQRGQVMHTIPPASS
eukprot:Gb_14532 [translate_table: standard]